LDKSRIQPVGGDHAIEVMAIGIEWSAPLDELCLRVLQTVYFESQLLKLSLWLNDYCYGRRALKRDKRLTIFGGIEIGELSGKLHAHLIIKNDADIKRSIYEINFEVRKLWAKATKAKGSIFNSLVDFQKTQNIKQSAEYALKKVRTNQNDTLLYI
jgi:hypothetical protein